MLLDHIVILVDDLDLAVQDYTDLGFSVVMGGEHADGVTRNALVAFEDGSYLELLNFLSPPPQGHMFAHGAHSAEGIIAYALLPDDIEAEVEAARRRGLQIRGPLDGGRTRPDGLTIAWKTARPTEPGLPFLCADVTPRDLRVPHGPARMHPNGVTGIAGVTVLVSNPAETARLYAALLSEDAQDSDDRPSFTLGHTTITLTAPRTDAERHHLNEHSPGAYSLALLSRHAAPLDPSKTHGVPMDVTRHSSLTTDN